jgi:hypothetical protein
MHHVPEYTVSPLFTLQSLHCIIFPHCSIYTDIYLVHERGSAPQIAGFEANGLVTVSTSCHRFNLVQRCDKSMYTFAKRICGCSMMRYIFDRSEPIAL